jgi:AraC-like DNA-binding protein
LELKAGHGKEKAKFISAALRLIHNPTRAHNENPLEGVLRLSKSAEHVFKDGVLLTNAEQIEASSRGPGASAFVNALMNLHLTHALRCGGMRLRMDYGFQELSRSPYLSSSEKSRAVATAVRLLNTHTEKGWTVAGLAQQVGQSRSTFAATFSACVGTGPMEYLNKVRMDKAAELLAEPRLEMPLVTIASRVGYGAASSFARAFKAHFGVSPRSFCSRYKNAL